MKVYSDGKSRSLNGAFPRRFRLMNAGKEVPFIRTGRESIRISGELPIGELDIQELVLPKKEPEIKAEKLDVGNVAIVNKADVERLDVMTQTLDKNTNRIEEQMNFIASQEKVLSDLETQNAESIELLSGQTASAVQMLKGAIDDAEKKNNAVQKALNKAISETSEDLSDSLVAHETANNPHRITKATIGLDKVENISPEDMPMTKEVKNAIDKKADKEAIKELKKKIDEAAKSQKNVEKGIERLNWVGGVGGNEIPSGGKKGQLLGKASNKTGDYTWVDPESVIEIKRVDVLPETGDSGTLYLVPSSDPQTSNIYDEYIWTDNGSGTYSFEKLGTTEVDLSGYVRSVNGNNPDENGNVSLSIFAKSTTAASTVEKVVSIPSIKSLAVGTTIIVQPTVTSTVANSTIKLNNFPAYTMRYNNANITTSTDSIVWNSAYLSIFTFDGTNWQFVAHGIDNNTTYSAMSVSEGTTGTATSSRAMRADYLKQIILGTKLAGLNTSTAGAVVATDSVLSAMGKIQATIGDVETLINAL